ncbi:hypothetical protein GIB67_029474 [Kingdonia uniflora]|uniref:Uncharacterized protein n=1 Tax=Kingdonia uniflora TaxID=39325 RepID=A0A7J7NXX5_9MAGN|nr:hypothetical protein GIB67_029474 [Kingdonia uniflora]
MVIASFYGLRASFYTDASSIATVIDATIVTLGCNTTPLAKLSQHPRNNSIREALIDQLQSSYHQWESIPSNTREWIHVTKEILGVCESIEWQRNRIEIDALQIISSATQIVSSIVGAVGALEQASRNLVDAPKKLRNLEEFVFEFETLTPRVKHRHIYKLHNPQLEHQIQSLNGLIERLHPNISKARKIVSRSRIKKLAKPQKLVEKVIDLTADTPVLRLRIHGDHGYPISNKCHYVKSLLDQDEGFHRVILIVGLSGIGKSCLARQVASEPSNEVRTWCC